MLTDAQRSDFEKRLRAAFTLATAGLAAELLRLLGTPPDVANVPAEFWAALEPQMLAEIFPIVAEMAARSALGLGEAVGVITGANWALVNTRAAAWAAKYSGQLVKGINATSQAQLQKLVESFIRDGSQDLRGLGAEIGKIFGPERGDRIAVTEATRATAQGEEALVREIKRLNPNAQILQIWLTSRDEITCPQCRPLHGKQRGDGWTEPPPKHPNCRCTTAITLPEVASG
jgi:hypothetical protein